MLRLFLTLLNTSNYNASMSKRNTKGRGRPFLPKDKARSVQLVFRVEPALHKKILKAAKREGKPLATWVRDTLTELLRSE